MRGVGEWSGSMTGPRLTPPLLRRLTPRNYPGWGAGTEGRLAGTKLLAVDGGSEGRHLRQPFALGYKGRFLECGARSPQLWQPLFSHISVFFDDCGDGGVRRCPPSESSPRPANRNHKSERIPARPRP